LHGFGEIAVIALDRPKNLQAPDENRTLGAEVKGVEYLHEHVPREQKGIKIGPVDVQLQCRGLWDRVVLLFGSEEKAYRWLHTRLSELDDRTPEEVLERDPHAEDVNAVLDRIEYGVFN
jgi:hypothetical protein